MLAQHTQGQLHHLQTVEHGVVLRPRHRFTVVVEELGTFNQISQILVRQVDDLFGNLLLSLIDEVLTDFVTRTTTARVQHHPNHVSFIKTDFDEVVATTQGAHLVQRALVVDHRVLGQDGVVTISQRTVTGDSRVWCNHPATVLGTSWCRHETMRHGAFDVTANGCQSIR
ncbi:hypothetical protein D3C80_1392250 [compost metagenome]